MADRDHERVPNHPLSEIIIRKKPDVGITFLQDEDIIFLSESDLPLLIEALERFRK